MRPPTPDAYFDEWWGRSDDPWAHATRWSEARKYRLTAAALPRPRYDRSFEPGCGIGVLTTLLAARSPDHLAMERHPRGVAATRERCAGLPGVTVVEGRIPDDWPAGSFDLVVLSEVLYYLSSPELDAVLDRAVEALVPGGDLVAVHHRPSVDEHTWTGDEVHERLRAHPGLTSLSRLVEEGFVLDVLQR
ncbi:class I SAM-dependent methyltransferase [Iamia sp. SCSIO 61187]|uniref:class I SAM-dependent DNA methyltransferase n=1 Tax=Iamia sp. SCSIO 61187 TaxID=2722752 RepID=UPI001C6374DE|nr:class I SAM-dependent methyltransferase [Iamia sp. SCSIO 61187]QYG91889.1 class I SAM-dependent methyltransferase [Iamia sp. SCSIO 61187]